MKTLVIKVDIADEAAERLAKAELDFDRVEAWRSSRRSLWDIYPSHGPTINGEFVYLTGHNPRIEVINHDIT